MKFRKIVYQIEVESDAPEKHVRAMLCVDIPGRVYDLKTAMTLGTTRLIQVSRGNVVREEKKAKGGKR